MLINPSGLMFDEITASNLLKVDIDGRSPDRAVAIRADQRRRRDPRRDLSPPAGRGVRRPYPQRGGQSRSCARRRTAAAQPVVDAVLRPLGYHDTKGVSLDMDERERLAHDIGQHPVLVLRNHGLLATGRNVAEAFSLTYHFERSAEAQLKIQAAAAGGSKIVVPSPDTCERQAAQFQGNTPRLQGQREWPACCACATASIRATGRSLLLSSWPGLTRPS